MYICKLKIYVLIFLSRREQLSKLVIKFVERIAYNLRGRICHDNWAVVLRCCRHRNFNLSRFELRNWTKHLAGLDLIFTCGPYLPTLLLAACWFLLLQSVFICYPFILQRATLLLIALFVSIWLWVERMAVVKQP